MVVVTAVTVVGVRAILFASIDTAYHRDETLRRMQASRSDSSSIVHRERPAADGMPAAGGGVLQRARERERSAWGTTRPTCRSVSSTATDASSASTSSLPRPWRHRSA